MLGEKGEWHRMQCWSWESPVHILVSDCAHRAFDQFSKLKFKNGPGVSCFSVLCIYWVLSVFISYVLC